MTTKPLNFSRHYLRLAGIILLGAVLRFWQLDLKPLWPDEIITALFSLGRSYGDVPLEVVFSVDRLAQIFTLQPALTCPQIAQTVATQSVHPPLFFCLMHGWLNWTSPLALPLIWKLRVLPALTGTVAIAAIYSLNRVAFSPAAGLMAAAVMAVSPFAVYLSQEARHYTLPMLLIILALLGLVRIQQDFGQRSPRLAVWLGWMAVNAIGFYVHYFFLLAFVAQVATLIGLMLRHRQNSWYDWGTLTLAVTGVVLSYLPWLPTLLGHLSRPETDWLKLSSGGWSDRVAPVYQTLAGWIIMAIALPVESQPLWIVIPATLLMLGFTSWLGWQFFRGIKQLWRSPETHLATWTLVSFTLIVLLQFFVIVYILGKDITVAPRYNFTYYPGICALLGASLVNLPQPSRPDLTSRRYSRQKIQATVLLVGVLSCSFVTSDLAFHKPFNPQQVARDISLEPAIPRTVVVEYDTFQDVALGLSYAREVDKFYANPHQDFPSADFGFFPRNSSVAKQISKYEWHPPQDFNLWIVSPRRNQGDYPLQLALPSQSNSSSSQTACTLDPSQYHQVFGISYQLYRCSLT